MLNEKDLPVAADWRQKMLSVQKNKIKYQRRGVCEKITASSPVGWVGCLLDYL